MFNLGTKLLGITTVIFLIVVGVIIINNARVLKDREKKELAEYRDELLSVAKQDLKKLGQTVLTTLDYYYEINKDKIEDEDKMIRNLLDIVKGIRYGEDGYFWINDTTRPYPVMLMHSVSPALDNLPFDKPSFNVATIFGDKKLDEVMNDKEYMDKVKNKTAQNILAAMVEVTTNARDGFVFYMWPKPGEEEVQPKLGYVIKYERFDWIIGTGVYIDHIEKKVNIKREGLQNDFSKIIVESVIFSVIFLLLGWIILTVFIRNIVILKITKMTAILKEISGGRGDLTQRIEVSSNDELGKMAEYFNTFIERLNLLIGGIKNDVIQLDDASNEIAISSKEVVSVLKLASNTFGAVVENTEAGKNIVDNSLIQVGEILNGISDILKMSDNIEDKISQSSASIEEMAANIISTANISQDANSSAEQLEDVSRKGGESVHNLISAINEVAENSKKIEDIVLLIAEISEQTDLLAMNAAIEAAHAGEAGKGFAVVADEIRKLADSSAQGAKQIQGVVSQIASRARANIGLAGGTRENFETILLNVEKVKTVNNEIVASMNEQKGANQVILESILDLKSLGQKISSKSRDEMQKSKDVEASFNNLINITEKIYTLMAEQKAVTVNITEESKDLSLVANKLKIMADKLNDIFDKFKTG